MVAGGAETDGRAGLRGCDLAEGRRRVDGLVAAGHKRLRGGRRVADETGLSRRELFREPGTPSVRP